MDQMDAKVKQVLDEYEERSATEAKRHERDDFLEVRDQFLLAVGPATGKLINLLVKESGARTILEIGTSYGYSTTWLAEAARETGGRVITMEWHANKQLHAAEQLAKAGLVDRVDFRIGDAQQSLAKLEEPIDFVLLDLWKDLYIPCFDLFYPRLNPGAVVVADNMIFPEGAQRHALAYRKHVRSKTDIQSILLDVGSGLEISRCIRGLEPAMI
jgi:predicted O-methyltransferase YrrM